MRLSRTIAAGFALFGVALLVFPSREPGMSAEVLNPSGALTQDPRPHPYDVQYPLMNYLRAERTDPVARLERRIERGEAGLDYHAGRGYLDALLEELGIDPSSQSLVFSRTSAQTPFITTSTPRALYYADDVYVGWPPGAPDIEIAAMDPNLGPVFYTLAQDASAIRIERRVDECLRCHDTYALTGGGVPRYLVGSGYTNDRGEQVAHEGWILVDDRTPLRFRWGGWYVTGTHGSETHMGNWIIRDPQELADIDLTRTGNVTDLASFIDEDLYPTADSDIVALLVLDHQTHVQNVITRVNYETRKLLGQAPGDISSRDLGEGTLESVATIAEPLVEALLMVGQPTLNDTITGTSDFARLFEARGRHDAQGRTLRELDLSERLFRYPVSYLVDSDAFDALPEPTRRYVYRRLSSVLEGRDENPVFSHVSGRETGATLDILRSAKADFTTLTTD